MKHSLTALVLGLSILGISTVAEAQNNTGLNGSGYKPLDGLSLKIGANYSEFSNGSTNYGSDGNSNKDFNIKPAYQWGYDIGFGYHIPYKDSDLDLDYTHINSKNSSSEWGTNLWLGPTGAAGPFDWIEGTNDIQYDRLDLTAGHTVKINKYFDMNYYGGLDYTSFKQDYTLRGEMPGSMYTSNFGDSWYGYGPTFGLDGDCYPFEDEYPGFGVYGGVKLDTLYGTRTRYSHTDDNGTLTTQDYPDENIFIPGVTGSLGVKYHYQFPAYSVDANLGYRTTQYLGTNNGTNQNNTPGNIGLGGFMLGAKIGF